MKKMFHIRAAFSLFIILTIGLIPSLSYACGAKSEKYNEKIDCCKSEKKPKKDCCKKQNSEEPNSEEKGCNGDCENSSCHCSNVTISFAVQNYLEIKVKTLVTESEKTKLYYNENYHSDGFISIWTPPNIG